MARFLPFDPSHDQIYEEYQVTSDSLNLDTVAFDYVVEAARSGAQRPGVHSASRQGLDSSRRG